MGVEVGNSDKIDNLFAGVTGEILRRKCAADYPTYVATVNEGFVMTRFHRYVTSKIQEFLDAKTGNAFDILLIATPPRHGKAVADSVPVLTTQGWKSHGDLKVGDKVYAPNGKAVSVQALIPQFEPASLLVTTTDGAKIKVHPNHEWVVYDRYRKKYVTIETHKMLEHGVDNTRTGRGHKHYYRLPTKSPIEGEYKSLFVPPYVLGAWLGDGSKSAPKICAHPSDIAVLDECSKAYPEGVVYEPRGTNVVYYSYHGLRQDLERYNLCHKHDKHNKYIPEEYLTASKGQRLQLLAGLLDTDGYLRVEDKKYKFTTADEGLRDTFCQLVATFGWRVSINEVQPSVSTSGIAGRRVYWSISFNPTEYIPCRLERKQLHNYSKQRRVAIKSIEPCEPEHCQCITVEGGVYLVGEKLTPTHNSFMLTETLPSWFLGKHPRGEVILCSYQSTFAESFSKINRDKFNTYGPKIFHADPDMSRQSAELWFTKNGGRCRAAGLDAGITGFGADLFIIDDPIKNAADASSEVIIKKILSEMGPSVQSRIYPGGKLIVIQTRWVENDVVGFIRDNWSELVWDDINLPCEYDEVAAAEGPDPLGRKIGDSLMGPHVGDPELPSKINNDNKWLQSKKKIVMAAEGARVWNALYQGRPTAQSGNTFSEEWFGHFRRDEFALEKDKNILTDKEWEERKHFEYLQLSIDATFKGGVDNDFVAMGLRGIYKGDIYLYHQVNKRMSFVDTVEKIKWFFKEYPEIDEMVLEDKANGPAIADTLRYTDDAPPVVCVNPMGGKQSRAEAITPFLKSGGYFVADDLPEGDVDWYVPTTMTARDKIIAQHKSFPFGKHDDMVDENSQGTIRLIKLVTGEAPRPERRYIRYVHWYPDMWEDFDSLETEREREKFIATYGAPEEWRD